MIVAVEVVVTAVVETANVPEVAPAGTVIMEGTVASVVSLELKVTAKPPVGAGSPSVTVPVELFPPMTALGLSETPVIAGGLTVRFAVVLFVPKVAVMTAVVTLVTVVVLAVKVAVVAPAATATDAGTVAAALFDERLIE